MTVSWDNNDKIIAQKVLALAREKGATQASVRLKNSKFIEVGFRDGALENASSSAKKSLSLRVYMGKKFGVHSLSDLREDTIEDFVSKAVALTDLLEADPYRGLADSSRLAKSKPFDLDVYDPKIFKIPAQHWIDLAQDMEKNAQEKGTLAKVELVSSVGSAYAEESSVHLATSHGFAASFRETGAFASCNVVFLDEFDPSKRRSGAWWEGGRYLSDLNNNAASKIAEIACKRAFDQMGAKPGPTAKMQVLVENLAAGKLVSQILQCVNGRSIYQKRSYLADQKGKSIASPLLTIKDEPLLKKGFSSRWFDEEGVATKPMTLVKNGVLENYLLDSYHSRALSMEPTTGSASNVIFEKSSDSNCLELEAGMEKGVVITSFLGGNFNSTTGDFSYGLQGRYVENGKVKHAVMGMNIAGNARDLWNRLAAVGNDPYLYSSVRCPSLLFENIQVTGI